MYRNGAPLTEPYLATRGGTDCAAVTVPDGSVYVLGDDRAVSLDSRRFRPVPESDVTGRLVTRVWPPARLGGV